MSSGKLILFLIAMVIGGIILLLGYKLDKCEEKGKRKEKFIYKHDNRKNDNFYDNSKLLKNNYQEQQMTTLENNYYNLNKKISRSATA